MLDARGTAAKDPAVTMDVAGSVFFPMDCHLTPERFLAAMQAEIEALGVEMLWQTEVTGLRAGGGRVDAVDTG